MSDIACSQHLTVRRSSGVQSAMRKVRFAIIAAVCSLIAGLCLLHAFHLVPYTNLRTQFWEEKGVMQSNSVYFYTMPHGMVDVLVKYCRACDPPKMYPYENASTSFTGYVEIDLSAPEIARKKAFGINTACLIRWAGCDSTAQLLPTVWQKAGQNTVRCIIPNREGVFDLLQMR
jgi:hypothetical protein